MKRREFIRFLGGAALAAVLVAAFSTTLAWSQPPDKPRRVGVLRESLSDPVDQTLVGRPGGWPARARLGGGTQRDAGRPVPGGSGALPRLAKELVALKVDVIVAGNMQSIEAARRATATIPIVMAGPTNP